MRAGVWPTLGQLEGRSLRSLLILLPLWALLSGCAAMLAQETRALMGERPADWPARVELSDTPFHPQAQQDLCGPESLAAVLGAVDLAPPIEQLKDWVYVPGRGGAFQTEMLAAARRAGAMAVTIEPSLSALIRELVAGHPVVVLQNLGLSWAPSWHYAVAIGYDLDDRVIILRSGPMPRQHMAMATFELTWHRSQRWAFVALPPGRLPAAASQGAVLSALIGFERVGSPADLARAYDSGLTRWPDNLPMAIGLGSALYQQDLFDQAAAVFQRAATQHASPAAYNNLARTEAARGRREAALAAARRAVDLAQGADAAFLAAAQQTLKAVQALPR